MNSTAQFHRSLLPIARPNEGPRSSVTPPAGTFANTLAASRDKNESSDSPATLTSGTSPIKLRRALPVPGGIFSRIWSWLSRNRAFGAEKQLRISETLSLGEKRFVALLHVEGRKFLIGGGASGVSLLTPLEPAADSTQSLQRGAGEQSQ